MRRPGLAAVVLAILAAGSSSASAEIPNALVVLEVLVPAQPGDVPAAAPPRFVLMEDGTVYVGGTRDVRVGKLESSEQKDLDRRLGEVRKLPLTGVMTIGPGSERRRLFLKKGRALDMVLNGDPADAPSSLRALAALVTDLARFQHPSLRPYEPASFAMSAKEGALPGGCRPWTLPEPLAESVFAPRVVPAKGHGDWPTGAIPAAVCLENDKRYVVTFRPLLPGERP
ncbi:MAG TPA: hypothetical protein VFK70_14620 [Vicinamibacteria bacterium]|nr:hypothetical protein [Vicinamibacteria bacterium]